MPATVQAILAARIDRLTAGGQGAAPDRLGRRQGRAVGRAPGGRRAVRGRAAPRLARLQAAEFLYETSLFPDAEYTFKHALTHEVAYGSLLQDRRRALHARIVDAIEDALPRPARRARRAAGPPRAPGRGVGQGRRLPPPGGSEGDRRARRYREAAAVFEQALDALQHLPESRARREQAIDLRSRPAQRAAGAARRTSEGRSDIPARPSSLPRRLGDERRLGRGCSLDRGQRLDGWAIGPRAVSWASGPWPSPTASRRRGPPASANHASAGRAGHGRVSSRRPSLRRTVAALQGDRR